MADRIIKLTAEIVSSYVEANAVTAVDLPGLIKSINEALSAAGQPGIEQPEPVVKPTAAQIRKSITPDALISFIDGRPYQVLRRHLTRVGLTPMEYRVKFGLPSDYPIIAASYSEKRAELARSMALGRKSAAAPRVPDKAGAGARAPKAGRSPKVTKSAE